MPKPFNQSKYEEAQIKEIKERMRQFPKGKFYFEIGGKFMHDRHAASVLPGFDPESKVRILQKLDIEYDIIFCINSPEIASKRIWKKGETYEQSVLNKLKEIEEAGLPTPQISVNLYQGEEATDEIHRQTHPKRIQILYKKLHPMDIQKILIK
ncbi:DUF1846 family protein [Candidatus Woesebacteria bacterium]|nr:DUF1846 family protein [Candidatus Woesebacteria bacterium]